MKPRKRDSHEMLVIERTVHIVPRCADVEAALCGDQGPFKVFFSAEGLVACSACRERYESGWNTSADRGTGGRRQAATPRQAIERFTESIRRLNLHGLNPQRIQRKRSKGWRKPEREPGSEVIDVTRAGKWGNPYSLKKYGRRALLLYRSYLDQEIAEGRLDPEELRGRDLMCWCPVGSPCHGDILLEKVNR